LRAKGQLSQRLPTNQHNHTKHTTPQTMNITASSTKADIIDASMELITTQDEQIADLKQRQTILIVLCVILGTLLILS
jgi:hypothetical protein